MPSHLSAAEQKQVQTVIDRARGDSLSLIHISMRENNDIAPCKNILNEMDSKDISKKVHASYLLKAQQGQFTGCVAPFGYRKDPDMCIRDRTSTA